jgi:hypothetical protein
MLIEKLADGVVQVQTPIGPRYVMPSFLQRVYLLWTFRNFPILPHAVLNRRQQRMIDRMCREQRFASMAYAVRSSVALRSEPTSHPRGTQLRATRTV